MEENERRGLEATKGMKHEHKKNPSEQKKQNKN
jgi:hypothetical protein